MTTYEQLLAWQRWAHELHGDHAAGDERSREIVAGELKIWKQVTSDRNAELVLVGRERDRERSISVAVQAEVDRLTAENAELKANNAAVYGAGRDLASERDRLTVEVCRLRSELAQADQAWAPITDENDQLRELAGELVAMRGHSTACPAWGSADDSAPCFCILAKAKALGIGGEG